MSRWQPVTIPAYDPKLPREVDDPRDKPVDFVLTQSERSKAAAAAVHIEANRRQQNRRETAQAAADALARETQA